MSLFVDPMSSSLTTEVVESEVKSGALRGKQTRRGGGGALKVKIDRAADDDGLDREKQFLIFQMGKTEDQPSMFEVSEVRPEVDGSENEPDVLVHLEMQSFNLAKSEAFDKDTAATIRLNFGKDENSRDRYFDTAFWSIAAGLKLYNEAKNQKSAGSDLKSDFRKALANRPIEIPGGLGKLTFEVVKHEPPPWWKKIFTFLKSGAGTALTSTLGFPAVTGTAVNLLDQFLGRLTESKPDVLFKSIPMRLALSKLAADDYTGGNQRIRVGGLSPGFCVIGRASDFKTFIRADAVYYPHLGKLAPIGVPREDVAANRYDDPFEDVTYAIFRIGMKSTKIDPTFDFG